MSSAVSTVQCVHGPLYPLANVSKARCVHGPMCPRPSVSTGQCVQGPLCPRSDVSKVRCIHLPTCLRPAVSTHRYIAHLDWVQLKYLVLCSESPAYAMNKEDHFDVFISCNSKLHNPVVYFWWSVVQLFHRHCIN